MREHVFRRLNTGGVRLNAQEIRNSIFAGPFNNLLVELSRHPQFTEMWNIPPVSPNEAGEPSAALRRNNLYRQMRDVEYVLRVFALLDPKNIGGGMKGTLDDAMKRYCDLGTPELTEMKSQFLGGLDLAYVIGGKNALRVPTGPSKQGRLSASLFDALMVALIRKLDVADLIKDRATEIWASLQGEFNNSKFYELIVGRANTRASTIDRGIYVERLIESAIQRPR